MKTLLLIDANALIHRAFHALPPLTTPEGEPIGAIYGLTNALLKILKELQPDYVAAAFDRPEPTFREQIFKAYKAHRPPTPDELVSQINKAHSLFEIFGIVSLEKSGFEADDIIGTLVNKFGHQKSAAGDLKIIILTGDLDTLQLVKNDSVVVQAPKKGLSETTIYNEAAVRERFGISPDQITDYKGLVGDTSDNIPGIKGIGPKTAEKLLQEFDNLETLYQKMKGDHPLAPKILPQETQALLSKKLATLDLTVPLTVNLKNLIYPGLNFKTAIPYFTNLGFTSIVKRLLKSHGAPQKTGSSIKNQKLPANALLILNLEDALKKKKELNRDGLKIAYDWKELIKQLKPAGVETKMPIFDLKIAGWLLDPDQKDFSTEALFQRFLHERRPENKEGLISLFQFLKQKIEEYEMSFVFEKIEMPIVEILTAMEGWGIKMDGNALQSLKQKVQKEIAVLGQDIYREAHGDFNINSPRQVAEVLFEKLAIPTGKTKKTATGQRSTSENVLLALRDKHPIVNLILDYREDFKIKTSFIEPLLALKDKTGRVHTTYLQTGTATGRLASEKPNLQNIPQESKWSKELRKCFVAEKGFKLLSFDYSQLELRLLAYVSNDKKLLQAFLENKDIHQLTAAQVFNVSLEKVTPEMRRLGKTLNFGVVYGMGARGFSEMSGLPLPEAEQFIAEYFHDFPEIQDWQEKIKREAATSGYIQNLNHRRRWLLEINSPNPRLRSEMERRATNMPIQSLGADIIKSAMNQTFAFLRSEKLLGDKVRLLLSIHDELLFEVRDDILKEIANSLKKIMESVYQLKIPLKVEAKTGGNWGEMQISLE